MIKIESTQNFGALAEAFVGEYTADCNLSCEVVIVDEDYIRRLNDRPLKKAEHPEEVDEEGSLFIGSIAVCRKRAEEQAEEYGHSFERELNYLVTHGIFHLLGYDHMTDADKAEMRLREERVLKKLGLSRED